MRVGPADEISDALPDLEVVGPLGHATDYGACYGWAPPCRGGMTPHCSAFQTERLGDVIDSPPGAGPTGTAYPVRAAPRLGSRRRSASP